MNKTKVAIYISVNQEPEGIDHLLQKLRNYCEANDRLVYAVYVDKGVSGVSMEGRFSLQRLLEAAEQQTFNEVLVWRAHQLSRKAIDLLYFLNELNQRGVQVRSITEDFDYSTPSGKLALHMLAAVSELEFNNAIENEHLKLSYLQEGIFDHDQQAH